MNYDFNDIPSDRPGLLGVQKINGKLVPRIYDTNNLPSQEKINTTNIDDRIKILEVARLINIANINEEVIIEIPEGYVAVSPSRHGESIHKSYLSVIPYANSAFYKIVNANREFYNYEATIIASAKGIGPADQLGYPDQYSILSASVTIDTSNPGLTPDYYLSFEGVTLTEDLNISDYILPGSITISVSSSQFRLGSTDKTWTDEAAASVNTYVLILGKLILVPTTSRMPY